MAATTTSQFAGFLKPEMAAPIFERATRSSVVQSLTRQVPLGINGQEIPVVTAKPKAGWVSEAGKKPVTSTGIGLKTIKPHKIAAITVVSAEVVRANPGSYMDIYREQIAEAFAEAFDAATLHGTDSPFDSPALATATKSVELGTTAQAAGGIYGDLNAALKLLVDDRKRLSGFAFDTIVEPTLNSAVDLNGRPLFVESTYEGSSLQAGRLLGRSAFMGQGVASADLKAIVGFAGDWSQAVWGVVGGISYDVSTQATVTLDGTLTSLWEHNLVAIRAEAEYGWLVNDIGSFVKVSDAA